MGFWLKMPTSVFYLTCLNEQGRASERDREIKSFEFLNRFLQNSITSMNYYKLHLTSFKSLQQ